MDEQTTTNTKGPRYDLAMPRDRRPGEPITWFVIDTTGRLVSAARRGGARMIAAA